tara:strand:- start:711 stop:845 length:135 start_codon:yes stop_codon:yes gene_type:complete
MKQKEIDSLVVELEWYRTYSNYIGVYYPNIDAEACSYADGDYES